MTILVTGGCGYIGSHVVHALVDRGEKVAVIDNLSTGFARSVPESVPVCSWDIGAAGAVEHVIKQYRVDEILHFAGSVVVPESVYDPIAYYANNTTNSLMLIDAAIRLGVRRFIFSSTAAVYGNALRGNVGIRESDALRPLSPYGNSKMMTEIMLRDAGVAHELDYVILRYFNVAGADPQLRTGQSTAGATHLIKVAVEAALGMRPSLKVFGANYDTPDGTCIRDYIHVTDLASAHLASLNYLRARGGADTFNCGYGRGYSVFEVIDAVRKASGNVFHAELVDRRPGDAETVIADSSKLRHETEWAPQLDDLDTIVHTALEWEKKSAATFRLPCATAR